MPTAAGLHYFLHEGGGTTKPPIILLHGAGGDHLSWPPEARRLHGFRVFTLDLPGHGKSEGPGLQSVEDYARSVLEFVNTIQLSRAVFFGHCMGGAIALKLGLDHPNRVAGLGLISTGARLPVLSSILENAANTSTFPLALNELIEISFGPQAPASLKVTTLKRLSAIRQTSLYGDLIACDRFDVSDRLDTLWNIRPEPSTLNARDEMPVLVMCGTDDKLTPVHFSETLASRIPGAALQILDEASHMLILEQPQRLAKLMSVFLATIPYFPGM